jgi:MoaA/NifB/PqqE/SkfB family radical SAM enzyme
MNTGAGGRLAYKHARGLLHEELYLKTGVDFTRPVKIYATVNERCNYRCRYCEYWRMKEYADEMSIDEWKSALASLKEFLGRYHIEFSGGEPFIKKGFVDLLHWCRGEGIDFGVTTNGSALKPASIGRFVATAPFNVNISVDSYVAAEHDHLRGIEGSLEHLVTGIHKLREEQQRQGIHFPVIVKPTVTANNFRQLPRLAEWAVGELGATMVNFQPVDRWTPETYDELWIEEPEHDALEEVVQELIRLKRGGIPIMNSEQMLGLWVKHFRGEKAPPEAKPCRVGLRNFLIRANGDVEVCWYWPVVGSIKQQSARDIWTGALARERREETTACDRLCLFSCLSNNSLLNKASVGVSLLLDRHAKRGSRPGVPV